MRTTRKIIHVDMDAFYASVEQRDNPSLKGRPVIVGGRPTGRGVVAACSYEARQYGVHSAMPSAEAGRRCPNAIFIAPRFSTYQAASQQIQSLFKEFTDCVEPLSLDEAYLDVTQTTHYNGSAVSIAKAIKQLIFERTGLVASAGVSYNKLLAKLASDYDKPDGFYCVLPGQGETFVGELPIGKLRGVGRVTESRMHKLNVYTGADLRRWSEQQLVAEFGKSGYYLYNAARGIDDRPVQSSRVRKSLGSERTFSENLIDVPSMQQVMLELVESSLLQLKEKNLAARTISIKVRFANFNTYSKAYSLSSGVMDLPTAKRVVPVLLDRALAEENYRPASSAHPSISTRFRSNGIRLLGVSFRGLSNFDVDAPKQLELPGEGF